MPWRPLHDADPTGPPKLAHLRRAQGRKLRVPTTFWCLRDDALAAPPAALGPAPWILRSAALSEDRTGSSRAGQFASRVVADPEGLASAFQEVCASMTGESARSCVLLQPYLTAGPEPVRSGVAFFDGFTYEVARAEGGNEGITSGGERGAFERGSLRRGDAFSDWLRGVARAFADVLAQAPALDLEFVERHQEERTEIVLLQARAAPFPLRSNRLLSLANHREILGDPPSPWMAAALERAGARATEFFAAVDPAIRAWDEPYAVARLERAWLNVSFFHRMMDRWGLPRTFVTEGVGGSGSSSGDAESPADGRLVWRRFLLSAPRLVHLQARSLWATVARRRALRRFARSVEAADDLPSLFDATVHGLETALATNFAINGVWTGVQRTRRRLGIRGSAHVVTDAMRADYDAIRRVPRAERGARLRDWLRRYGHRGPLESDLARPRFRELEATLRAELASAPETTASPTERARPSLGSRLLAPLFWIDRVRESFRDELMALFEPLRHRLLARASALVEAGALDTVEDVFWLSAEDVRRPPSALRGAVARRRSATRAARAWSPPGTATEAELDELERTLGDETAPTEGGAGDTAEESRWDGIGIGAGTVRGRAKKADDLVRLLDALANGAPLAPDTILVVPALEPSWAVLFDRVAAVVAELGGELSHASILLREMRKPAVVNVPGVFARITDGQVLELDAGKGRLVTASDPREPA